MDRDLEGLGVAISGGGGDIGAAMAAELLRRGAAVTLIDLKSETEATPWLARIAQQSGEEPAYVRVDVRDRSAVAVALEELDSLDAAIGNAGIIEAAPFLEVTSAQWQRHLDVNLTGCFNLGQAAARQMMERGKGGSIVFTGSWVGEVPWPEDAAYSVSKAGVHMLARSMARELAPYRILVNVVAPGIVDAGLARAQMEADPNYARQVARVIPLGELQSPEQVAKVTAFLCSGAADYLTGSIIVADGGCSLFHFDS